MISPNTRNDKPYFNFQSLGFFFFFFLLSFSLDACPTEYYCPISGAVSGDFVGPQPPLIHFPFTVAGTNHSRQCGYPGFNLTCNNRSIQPIISFRSAGDFTVQQIDYINQLIWISDPDNCLPNRILTLDISNSPFFSVDQSNYTFLNCTTTVSTRAVAIPCLGGGNFTVYASSRESTLKLLIGSGDCKIINSVLSPSLWPLYRDESGPDLGTAFIPLSWSVPNCGLCERNGGVCRFKNSSGLDVECSVSISGTSTVIKYGLLLGLVIPGILCAICLAFYMRERRIQRYMRRQLQQARTELSPSMTIDEPPIVMVGLDGQTIESYPKTLIGESRRLPNPSDVQCAICLSEYEAKEALRTIPECNHYFHAECIDEWLKMKGTCPLCRNSPGE